MTQPIIRLATEEDIFDILVLAREFSKEAPVTHKWDREKTETFIRSSIDSPLSTLFVLEDSGEIVGALVGLIHQMYMSQTTLATELGWFVSRDYRGRKGSLMLMKSFEKWAKDQGADYVVMGDISKINVLEKLYTKFGYKRSETVYMKEL